MKTIVENVVYQHAENACSLWMQRQNAVEAPHYSFDDLVQLDGRVEANIDGLRIAGEHGLLFVDEMIKADDIGAYFTKALLALEEGNYDVFFSLINEAESKQHILVEIKSALAWVQPKYLQNIVKTLLSSEQSGANILGLSACASHCKNPGKYLETHLASRDPEVRCAALRVGSESGNLGIVELIANKYECETEKEKYELGRALAFLGKGNAANTSLSQLALSESKFNTKAVIILVQLSDSNTGRSLLKKLDKIKGRERDVIRGFGLLGDPVAIGWLIQKMEVPEMSRLAGDALTMITGVDLADQNLESQEIPEGFNDGGINDDPSDENVALDEDEDLPWPNPKQVSKWWESSDKLPTGKLFLNGLPKNTSELQQVLSNGMQRQRNIAAMNISLSQPESKYLDTRLPTVRQKLWMS